MIRAVLTCLMLLFGGAANAHALDPGYLNLSWQGGDAWAVLWSRPDVGGAPMSLAVQLPPTCKSDAVPSPQYDGRAWVTRWQALCPDGLAGRDVAIPGLERTQTDVLLRYAPPAGQSATFRLTAAQTGVTLPQDLSGWQVLGGYIGLGFDHILEGWDHLAFVLGLTLLIGASSALFWAVTAFTLAHSLTLAGVTLGLLGLPSAPVEAVIALSVLFLALDLAQHDPAARMLARRPWCVAFGIGLLHGFGFAGALGDVGLPQGDWPLALLGFNLGVELGQLLVVALVLSAAWLLARHMQHLRHAIALGLGGVAAYWTFDRVLTGVLQIG